MTDDSSPLPRFRWTADLALAVVFLTRLPLRLSGPPAGDAHARAMAWFPLVGAGVGLAGGAVYVLAALLHLPPLPAALLALGMTVWLTGGLHEDGAADVADGFGGGRDKARKLEIMRDSRVGSYGVLAIVFSIAIRASALAALAEPRAVLLALAASGALSRGGMAVIARTLNPARADGLAARQGRPAVATVALSLVLAGAVALAALGPAAPAAILVAALVGAAMAWQARRQIGGHTGDVFGAAQQATEAAVLLALAALHP
ncbi:adenosylcobinamide-GDP ribazoletransferase [Azospirillum rugosum]|uniref:Adenosylcobinamide-GDP ribazoletransferase n=1 Tax=Azospirillum rugosum TaxID=416170 RepID=A0ABS4SIK6_9PROT|nr:adenosylcobinamide-GDP ribazoletransferase [Azospirillum rugosum]MBP2292310.1 adenosylcobinamide-GDP ribazoletransferase [Azospirillum rugosum]MDQ0526069.1 adenosylcobinamide-GDP ribazoletransferase [Azospirillum rugosum]